MGVLKLLLEKYKINKNPVLYWRKRGIQIGENCEIYASANFGSEPYLISIGNHVRINASVKFITHDGGVWVLRDIEGLEDVDLFGKISVGNNVHIGSGAIIMPGVTIGNNCVIGCGAVVTKPIPDNSIAVGVPARVIETVDEYILKHESDFDHTKGFSNEEKKQYLLEKFG